LGFKDTVLSFSSETVKDFHSQHYHAGNLTVSVVGNVDENIFSLLQKELEALPCGEKNSFVEIDNTSLLKKNIVLKHPAVANVHTVIGWRLPGLKENQDIASFVILESLLSYGRSSVLYQEIMEKGLAYGVSAGFEEFLGGSSFYIYGITNGEKNGSFKNKIFSILRDSFDRDSFEFAKKKILKSEIFKREAVETEAEEIGYSMTLLDNLDFYENLIEKIKAVSFEKFLNEISFLEKSPLIVELIPETMEDSYVG